MGSDGAAVNLRGSDIPPPSRLGSCPISLHATQVDFRLSMADNMINTTINTLYTKKNMCYLIFFGAT